MISKNVNVEVALREEDRPNVLKKVKKDDSKH